MTEPMAEQVNAEREEAHVVLRAIFNNEDGPWQCALKDRAHDEDCDAIATALARVRIEAVEGAARAAIERAHDLGIPADKQESIAKAIRALRGRT